MLAETVAEFFSDFYKYYRPFEPRSMMKHHHKET
jgi:hypothetical protein